MRQTLISILTITAILTALLLFPAPASGAEKDALLPKMEGWNQKGKTDLYTPANLYEYINGAADVFLGFDFQELVSASFENKEKHSFTVDIYHHSDSKNGFGIYSQEKPQEGPFLAIGSQGYYEKGVLNFLKGRYYVKISGFDLGENDKAVLTAAAKQVAEKLDGDTGFPKILAAFPAKGKVTDSERFVGQDYMGHSFLHSAFTTEYAAGDAKYQVFIMVTDSDAKTGKILEAYKAFVEKKGKKVEVTKELISLQDPYYRSKGTMYLKQKGNYLWGLLSKDAALAKTVIAEIDANLIKLKLVK